MFETLRRATGIVDWRQPNTLPRLIGAGALVASGVAAKISYDIQRGDVSRLPPAPTVEPLSARCDTSGSDFMVTLANGDQFASTQNNIDLIGDNTVMVGGMGSRVIYQRGGGAWRNESYNFPPPGKPTGGVTSTCPATVSGGR